MVLLIQILKWKIHVKVHGFIHEKSMDFHEKSMKNPQNSNSEGGVPRDD